jgi:hypothetical protein
MRRFSLSSVPVPVLVGLALLVLLAPAAASAQRLDGFDGSLAVIDGDGSLVVQGRGVIYGSFAQGTMYVLVYRPDTAGQTLSVSGAEAQTDADGVTTYTGSDVRFLLPSGHYRLEVVATGIDVSAVGRGTAGASAGTTVSAGSFALDGGKPVAFDHVDGPQVFAPRMP